MSDYLVFIDTNIFLDFYRLRGREKSLSILDHVAENQEKFIITSQVEMEFKKNRQKVILDSYERIRPPSFDDLVQLPAFLSDSKQSKAIETHSKRVKTLTRKMRERTERVLKSPTRHDPVYKAAQRHFSFSSPYNLDRFKKVRFKVRNLARKRYALGYPPRKPGDTSMGDAVNWEWIIHCASESGKSVVIVSRDSDFGQSFNGTPIINDWLEQEFRKRVSKQRKIILTNRLSAGLKAADIGVTKTEIDAEEEFLEKQDEYLELGEPVKFSSALASQLNKNGELADVATMLSALKEAQEQYSLPKSAVQALMQAQRDIAEPMRRLRDEMIGPAQKFAELQKQIIEPVKKIHEQLEALGIRPASTKGKPDKAE